MAQTPHAIVSLTADNAEHPARVLDTGATVLVFRGARIVGAAVLTVYDGTVAQAKVIATLSAAATANDRTQDLCYTCTNGRINYVLSAGSGELYYHEG